MSSAGQVLLETVPASAVLSVLPSWSRGAVGVVGAERGLFIDFVGFSYLLDDLSGQIFSLFILVVAAAEAAIGLAILTIFFKKTSSISIDTISKLKG